MSMPVSVSSAKSQLSRQLARISHIKVNREASSPDRGNEPVPWSSPQTELVERTPVAKRKRRTEHRTRH